MSQLTIKQALIDATQSLIQASETPRLDVELFMSQILGVSRIKLFSEWNSIVSDSDLQRFNQFVERRRRYEPVAYILGHKEFYGRDFNVSPAVLVPRPETELLIEKALACVGARSSVRLLDLGTGSGCVALTLAAELASRGVSVTGVAVDKSADALIVAKRNAAKLELSNVEFILSDWFESVTGEFDIIVSNPPYIADNDKELSQATRHEPPEALFAGPRGIEALEHILSNAHNYMATGAWLVCETGNRQRAELETLFARVAVATKFDLPQYFEDLAGHQRVVACQLK